ncbi:transposase [Fervidicella metallireducens AeB]|uniref:Transposase n=1 Tax=Fervidicella metallireducens AeB TaxID=1403537 RepID=A0A017RTE1_9CLOT|nr:IS30 family transposase [Fervidicella metallireducens]EYE87155.1 transposase [Fervidicella metallireducens AeB]
MCNNKHLTLSDRINIEKFLNEAYSFKAISREIDHHCTTVAKEVKRHITIRRIGSYGRSFNNCVYRSSCKHSYLCNNPTCRNGNCKFCSKCISVCKDYKEERCPNLLKPPYVCNGCKQLNNCRLEKAFYYANTAHEAYKTLYSQSRTGIAIEEDEVKRLDSFISPLIAKGQSIHHICTTNRDTIMCSEKTIYNYISYNLFTARNIDLPRKVRYRKRKKSNDFFKVDKSCRIGRTYDDFIKYMDDNPDTHVVEMDTVEGVKGGKVLLTLHFRELEFMMAFIRDANTSQSVINIFEDLYWELNPDNFNKLFPIILTDNGSEFSNPSSIEFDKLGNRRTRIFYCNPSAPQQKGAAENNHEMIRRVIPKGHSLDKFTQADITLMMNHINSYARKKLNNQPPYQLFSLLYGNKILEKIGAILIAPNEIILKPELLKK